MKKVFVVILNWNQPKLTIECLQSLQKVSTKGYETEIVLIDNGSSDDSLERLRAFKGKKFPVRILANGSNLGFAAGNNVGIKYALNQGGDYIALLNNDTTVKSDFLSELLKVMEKDEKIGAASSKIYFAKGYEFHKQGKKYKSNQLGKVIWYAGGKIDWKNVYGSNRGVDEVDKGQYDKSVETDFATGACVIVRAEALKKVGMFDEKYYLYLEDADLSMRLKKRKYKVMYAPKSVIWHKVSQSSGIGSDLNDYFISRNRLLFGFRYAKMRAKLALMRESLRLFFLGRHWQAVGIRDFYLRKFGKGSWE